MAGYEYTSIKFQINREIEHAVATSEMSTNEVKRKLINSWNQEVYDVKRVSDVQASWPPRSNKK